MSSKLTVLNKSSISGFSPIALQGAIVGIGACVILAPQLRTLIQLTTGTDYYSHIPVVILAAVVLAILRWKEYRDSFDESASEGPTGEQGWLTLHAAFFLGAASLLMFAVWYLGSAWLAIPAILCVVWGSALLFLGKPAIPVFGPSVLIVLVSSPLPVGLDQSLVVGLQRLATALASVWLDLLGVFHVVTGVAIQTPKQAYLVEDACSGISSFFAAISLSAGYCALNRLGLVRSLAILLLTVAWTLVANAVRVLLIVAASVRFDIDLTTGWTHELLGIATFSFAILLALSTERMFFFLVPPRMKGRDKKGGVSLRKSLFGWLDFRMVSFNQLRPVAAVITVIFFAVFATAGYAAGRKNVRSDSVISSESIDPERFAAISMPEEVAGWRLVDSEILQRSPDDLFGMVSWIWRYRRGDQQMAISIDGPYSEWHDLAVCYTAVGWQVQSYENLLQAGAGSAPYAVSLQLYREPLERADLTFVCFDRNLQVVSPLQLRGAVIGNFAMRLRKIFTQVAPDFTPPVYQIQVNANFGDVVSESDREGLEEVLKQAMSVTSIGVSAPVNALDTDSQPQ